MTEDKDKAEEAAPEEEDGAAEDGESSPERREAAEPEGQAEDREGQAEDTEVEPGAGEDALDDTPPGGTESAPPFRRRYAGNVAAFGLLSLGLYHVHWRWSTARDLQKAGASVPPDWMVLVPILHWFWVWKWSLAVAEVSGSRSLGRGLFYAQAFVPLLGPAVAQAMHNFAYPRPGEPPPQPLPRGWRLAVQLLLPPLCVGGAVWVHWALNVPDEIVVSPRDQGAKKKRKKRKKPRSRDRRAQRAKPRKPRSDATLRRSLARWGRRDFEDEPVVVEWARRHQTLVSKAFIEARREAFDGAPEEPGVALASTACKTVRCRFVVRSPFPHELDAVVASLRRVQADGESVWRSFQAETVEAPEGEPPQDEYLQVTIAWQTDEIEPASIEVAPPEQGEAESGAEEPEPEAKDAREHAAAG